MSLRCGRLDDHPAHDWTSRPLGADWPTRTHGCPGHVVTALVEQEWARRADALDAADDQRRINEREAAEL